ncbi:MAG: response regulator transcription factor [Lewinellaceae bacterium]|nr:response regulator transcription factor [Lewinellaceae bacterium]
MSLFHLLKKWWLLPLFALPMLAWLLPGTPQREAAALSPDKINLALRRTADGLLRQAGDSTSRIPAIEQTSASVWRVRLEQPFHYEQLPALLQASLDRFGIRQPYDVALRRCADATIDLGYHQQDYVRTGVVPCQGRDLPEICHFIEITFLSPAEKNTFWTGKSWLFFLLWGGLAGFWFLKRQKQTSAPSTDAPWLIFGNSRLDALGQVLLCNGTRHMLTYREAKLLRLFASSPDQLLEREFILQEVWADEGILVGRSVDVFVSRLRKKLAADPSVSIVAVHGVGYRLETGK